MLRIMSDNDVRGHVSGVINICQASPWGELWRDLECVACTFGDLELAADATDATAWQACQDNGILLITGNRDARHPDSLEVTLPERNRPDSLPVLTLANPRRIMRDRTYAEAVVERLFDILIGIDALRGTGRLYLP